MSDQQKTITKKRGRPATGMGQLIGVRLQPTELSRLDDYAAHGDEPMSRPEAIRSILREHLGTANDAAHPEPRGPATDVVKQMDKAIKAHRSKKAAMK